MPADSYQKAIIAQRKAAREQALVTRAPNAQGVQARAICVECVHHTCDFDWRAEKILHNCSHPALRHLVTGRPTDPYSNRQDEKGCGRAGNYWQALPKRPEPARIEREVFSEEPAEFEPPVPVRRIEPFVDGVVAVLWERAS